MRPAPSRRPVPPASRSAPLVKLPAPPATAIVGFSTAICLIVATSACAAAQGHAGGHMCAVPDRPTTSCVGARIVRGGGWQLARVSQAAVTPPPACGGPSRQPPRSGSSRTQPPLLSSASHCSYSRSETADEHHDRFFVNDEDERLDDLCDVAADRRSSIVRGSRAVRERTNLDLQSATRRRGDQSIRAPHVRPPRESPRFVLPNFTRACSYYEPGSTADCDHDLSSSSIHAWSSDVHPGSEEPLTTVAE